MPARSPFSSTERFWLSALASFQSIVVWVVLTIFGLALVEKFKLLEFRELGAVGFFEGGLILALFLGILSMPFVSRFVWKATVPVVNERIPTWKKLIISLLSSMSVGQILWFLGMAVIVPILEKIGEYVPFLEENKNQVAALIAVVPLLVAMIWFGYKVYGRFSGAELIVAGNVGRKFGDAVRPRADDSSVKRGDGTVIKPQR